MNYTCLHVFLLGFFIHVILTAHWEPFLRDFEERTVLLSCLLVPSGEQKFKPFQELKSIKQLEGGSHVGLWLVLLWFCGARYAWGSTCIASFYILFAKMESSWKAHSDHW